MDYCAGALVESALDAVFHCLRKKSKDLAGGFHARWFAARNSPGPACVSPAWEWRMFAQVSKRSLSKPHNSNELNLYLTGFQIM